MKKLLFLVISLLSWFFSESQTLPKEVKEWCLSLNEQNKEYKIKLLGKDSIINKQGEILVTDGKLITSYKRDSVAWNTQMLTYKLIGENYIAWGDDQRKEIRRLKRRNIIATGALVTAVAIIIRDLFTSDE